MSLREAVLHHSSLPTGESHSPEVVVQQLSASPLFKVEKNAGQRGPLLTHSFGESCQRATYVNGYHTLLCGSRLVVVKADSRHRFSFPPFPSSVTDAYVERVSEDCILVVVGTCDSVHVALVDVSSSQAHLVSSSTVPTFAAVAKVHRLREDVFAVCLEDGDVRTAVVSIAQTPTIVKVSLRGSMRGTLQAVVGYFSSKKYKDSCFAPHGGYLMVLSDRDISVWTYSPDADLTQQCSLAIGKDAVALLAGPRRANVATVVLRNGTLVPASIRADGERGVRCPGSLRLSLGSGIHLPTCVNLKHVTYAASGAETVVLYDDVTSCAVVISEGVALFDEAAFGVPQALVVSPFSLSFKVRGVGFIADRDDSFSGTFVVYGPDSILLQLRRLPRGKVLNTELARSASWVAGQVGRVQPYETSEVLFAAVNDGLALSDMAKLLFPLLVPVCLDERRVRLSPGAVGLANHMMRQIDLMERLWVSFRHWELASSLDNAQQRMLRSCSLTSAVLNSGGWLENPEILRLQWRGFEASSETPLSARSAINAQADYLSAVLSIGKEASTLCWLYGLLLESGVTTHPSPHPLKSVLRGGEATHLTTTMCMQLLSLHMADVTRKLMKEVERLPHRAQLAVRVHALLVEDDAAQALEFVETHLEELVHCNLFAEVTGALEDANPRLLPTLRLMARRYQFDPEVTTALLSALETIPPRTEKLYDSLACLFSADVPADLQGVVLDWMERHSLVDERLDTFARVIADLRVSVDPAHTLTGRFFSCWSQEVNGNRRAAGRRFGELARICLAAPLEARLMCLEHAMTCEPSDADKLAQFTLLLQTQLKPLLEEHLACGTTHVAPRSVIEKDLKALSEEYLDEKQLFELAGRYRELGGASVQLDILKIHADSPEAITADTAISLLTFLKAIGLTATVAVEKVLKEYLPSFQGVFPLYPFLQFLACDGHGADAAVHVFLECGVTVAVVFDALLSLLDGRGSQLYSVSETADAMLHVISYVDGDQEQMCAAHLQECLRGILAGEYRSVALTDDDVVTVRKLETKLKALARGASRDSLISFA